MLAVTPSVNTIQPDLIKNFIQKVLQDARLSNQSINEPLFRNNDGDEYKLLAKKHKDFTKIALFTKKWNSTEVADGNLFIICIEENSSKITIYQSYDEEPVNPSQVIQSSNLPDIGEVTWEFRKVAYTDQNWRLIIEDEEHSNKALLELSNVISQVQQQDGIVGMIRTTYGAQLLSDSYA